MLSSLTAYTHWLLFPLTWVLFFQIAAVWQIRLRRYKSAAALVLFNAAVICAIWFTPLAAMALRPLEQAFRAPQELPSRVDGIISLAGAQNSFLTHVYGRPQLNSEAERLTEFIALAREYPEAKLVFSGGATTPAPITEGEVVRRFMRGVGFDHSRVIFEEVSRTTAESATQTHALLTPRPGEVWILITSASHMPRAHGAFRKAGWEILPYPVSYRTAPYTGWSVQYGEGKLEILLSAIHEWVGIAVYHATGKM